MSITATHTNSNRIQRATAPKSSLPETDSPSLESSSVVKDYFRSLGIDVAQLEAADRWVAANPKPVKPAAKEPPKVTLPPDESKPSPSTSAETKTVSPERRAEELKMAVMVAGMSSVSSGAMGALAVGAVNSMASGNYLKGAAYAAGAVVGVGGSIASALCSATDTESLNLPMIGTGGSVVGLLAGVGAGYIFL